MFNIFVIISSSLFILTLAASKYEHISECQIQSNHRYYNVSFVCGENNQDNPILYNYPDTVYCSGSRYTKSFVGNITFRNCRFREVDKDFFEMFKNLHTFNISNVELETLQIKTFRDAKKLINLIASNNRLTEIASHLFVNAENLSYVDFSSNTIKRIDSLAFEGAKNLTTLNFSYNQISQLDAHTFSIPRLLTLDLSSNNLTVIDGHTFDKSSNLKRLNLSQNSIGNLSVETFAYLWNLEHLNLSRTNLSSIQMGTFAHQHKLISLDLSGNRLKKIDFNLFMPILHDLLSLYLGQNQLTDLDGFSNSMYPKLGLLDIKNNEFNCTYLKHFMVTVDWEKLRLHIDERSINPQKGNIRGVSCEVVETVETVETSPTDNSTATQIDQLKKNLNENNTKSNQQNQYTSTDILFIKISLVAVCIMMLTFLIMFLITKRDQIFCRRFRSSEVYRKRVQPLPAEMVTYPNDDLL